MFNFAFLSLNVALSDTIRYDCLHLSQLVGIEPVVLAGSVACSLTELYESLQATEPNIIEQV